MIARLRAQLATMPVVEQAKGIIMAREGCAPEEAFDLLRRSSRRANLKLAVLAAFLVEQATRKTARTVAASEPERGGMAAGSAGDEPIVAGLSRRRTGVQVPVCARPGTVVVPHKRATATGTDFRVVAAHHYLRDRLVRTGLDAYLSLYATVGEALPAEAATELPSG